MEGIYQEQIKNLKEELKKEREERMDVMDEHDQMIEKMTTSYREESKKLKEDLSTTQEVRSRFTKIPFYSCAHDVTAIVVENGLNEPLPSQMRL